MVIVAASGKNVCLVAVIACTLAHMADYLHARERQQAEEEEARRAAQRIVDRRAAKRAALGPEPETAAAGVTTVRLRLPDGGMHQRRFHDADPLQVGVRIHMPEIALGLALSQGMRGQIRRVA